MSTSYDIPDIDVYYSVADRQYIYNDGTTWIHVASLPVRYSSYDPYTSYKVVINESTPYQNNGKHSSQYGHFKGSRDQEVIRNSHDAKYFVIKDHPDHDKWVKEGHH